jgi:hypothetical protein
MVATYPLWFYPGTILGFSTLVALTPLADVFDFNEQFFSAVAEVFPVLLIAMFAELLLEAEAFKRHLVEHGDDPEVVSSFERRRHQCPRTGNRSAAWPFSLPDQAWYQKKGIYGW